MTIRQTPESPLNGSMEGKGQVKEVRRRYSAERRTKRRFDPVSDFESPGYRLVELEIRPGLDDGIEQR